ncbi:MAG: amino acid adenylation domain-containing protein [Alphaproteobacteria bacterium]|nr:amino acid adenylation domain-containing protein [Alphaproteobacteria bacterium]
MDAVDRYGDRIALRSEDTEFTYRELDRRAQSLANRLSNDGLSRGQICGLYLERSIDCVISILAVTFTGGAWLPLDPNYEAARLRLMATDADIKFLVSNRDPTPLELDTDVTIYMIPSPDILAAGTEKHAERTGESDLAYVIYTSGSTGRPKGIQIEHNALIRFLDAMRDLLPDKNLAKVLSVTSPSFDISLLEIFLPLGSGGTVILANRGETRDGRLLRAKIESEQPTLIQSTPATWRMLLAAGWRGHDGLTLLTGGEVITPDLAGQLLECADTVWNLYGPTEATIWATAAKLSHEDARSRSIPIGRPLHNMKALIFDDAGRLVCPGEIGELYLSGPSLSRGYLNEAALTDERFVSLSEGRAYRTGDLASERPDGQIAFHGRIDHQVKHYGMRIEPAEIEAVLAGHSLVKDVVVAGHVIEDGNTRLVAYIVPQAFDPDHQRRQRLSDHWRKIWTREYEGHLTDRIDPGFNTAGLRSSYDGELISDEALQHNVEQICERVKFLKHDHILELGCGTGLIFFPLAPHCIRYLGVDYSPKAIADLKVEAMRRGLSHAEFLEQEAGDTANFESEAFDIVILNTVIQYFPDIAYLEAVLDNALRALRPGGTIFVGDVRELGALDAFHASLVASELDANADRKHCREVLRRISNREAELVFDPAWFDAFAATRPEVTSVEVAQKTGPYRNELVDYRFDVIMRKGDKPQLTCPNIVQDASANPDLEQLWQRLADTLSDTVLIENLTNSRRADAFALLDTLERPTGNLSEVTLTADNERTPSFDPTDIIQRGNDFNYETVILPNRTGSAKHFTAFLIRRREGVDIWSHRPTDEFHRQPPARLSNELQQSLTLPNSDHAKLIDELRNRISAHFPGPMRPTHYVVLRELPLTPARKIDRSELPSPIDKRPELAEELIPARDALELQISELISNLLGVTPVGIRDDFFWIGWRFPGDTRASAFH